MRPGWIIGILMLFVGLQVIMGICEMNYTNELPSVFSAFLTGGSWSTSRVNDMLNGLWAALLFDYPFFTGSWIMLRYIFMSVSSGVVILMIWQAPIAALVAGGLLGLSTLVTGGFNL